MDGHDERPRARRRRFFVRAFIFIGLAGVAEASAALPPGPNDVGVYWASLVLFSLSALSALLPWERLPHWAILVPTSVYLVSVGLVLVSGGTNPTVQSSAGGLSVLVLLPVLAMALYYPRSYSVFAVVAAAATLSAVGIAVQSSEATNLRRLLLWAGVTVVVSVTIHHLRDSLEGEVEDSAELARLGRLMNGATQSLTALRDPKDVIAEGTKVMAQLAGSDIRAASYLRVHDGVVTQEALIDLVGAAPDSYLLRDDPLLARVLDTGTPLQATVDRRATGSTLRALSEEAAWSYAALVPVRVDGAIHGVFRVDSGRPCSDDVVARCHALGNVVELALGNAIAHQELELQANTDHLTGLANRRGLALYLNGESRPRVMSILVMDIDGLKRINDLHGHDAGDRVLVAVAQASSSVLRGGDVLARVGGDEFVAVVAGADETDAQRVADRIDAAVSRLTLPGVRPSVSIGFASCAAHTDVDGIMQRADQSMYESKRVRRGPQPEAGPAVLLNP